jgi:hypothetical protein
LLQPPPILRHGASPSCPSPPPSHRADAG